MTRHAKLIKISNNAKRYWQYISHCSDQGFKNRLLLVSLFSEISAKPASFLGGNHFPECFVIQKFHYFFTINLGYVLMVMVRPKKKKPAVHTHATREPVKPAIHTRTRKKGSWSTHAPGKKGSWCTNTTQIGIVYASPTRSTIPPSHVCSAYTSPAQLTIPPSHSCSLLCFPRSPWKAARGPARSRGAHDTEERSGEGGKME